MPNGKSFKKLAAVSALGLGLSAAIPSAFAATDLTESAIVNNQDEEQVNNLLSKLEIEGTKIEQNFSSDVFQYSASVGNDVKDMTLNLESQNSAAVISVNDHPLKNVNSDTYSLMTGENKFLITVNDGTHPLITYSLTVTRKQNRDTRLKYITLSRGELSPKFDPGVTDYSVKVTNENEELNLSAETAESTSSIKVNNTLIKEAGVTIKLPVGKTDITLLVMAENGDEKSYTLHVTRAAKPDGDSPNLPGKQAQSPPAKGTNNTGTGKKGNSGSGLPGTSRSAGGSGLQGSYPNSQGSSIQGSTQQTGAAVEKVSTATLSSLNVSNGIWNTPFSSDEYTYHISVPEDVSSITLDPAAKYSSASFLIEGKTDKTIMLTGAKTVISVVVTRGEDRKTYTLVFDRPAAETTTVTNTTTDIANQTGAAVSSTEAATSKVLSASNVTGRDNKQPLSFWGRIIDFFKNLF